MSVGEQRHPGWVLEHPGRATRWVRAARVFISPKAADVPIYPRYWGGGRVRSMYEVKDGRQTIGFRFFD